MRDKPVLEMRGIRKAFSGVQALDGVDLELRAGEVMALVGENGAGKSTLVNTLAGVEAPDQGEIFLNGEVVEISNPERAQQLNIAIIHQELNLAAHLSVAENIFVGREFHTRFGLVDFRKMNRESQSLLNDALHDTSIRPQGRVGDLSLARQQMVEIVKALSLDAKIIVMDEPTSSLAGTETQALLELIERLRDQGVSIIYISHRLEEVFRISNRITVLRDGKLVGVRETTSTDHDGIVTMMVGRQLEDIYGEVGGAPQGNIALEVRGMSQADRLHDIDLHVRAGEILGMAGLIGAGRTELARAVFGADRASSGEILIEGQPVRIDSPQKAIEAGLGYVPENRKLQGLFLNMSVRENISAASTSRISKGGFIMARKDKALAAKSTKQLSIRAASMEQGVKSLSGGNQQKIVLAKWLNVGPKILILDEPTRGVDVGAKAEIYALIRDMAQEGMAIVVICSELPEILGLSDRIVVMREGRISGELACTEADEEKIMALATGANRTHPEDGEDDIDG